MLVEVKSKLKRIFGTIAAVSTIGYVSYQIVLNPSYDEYIPTQSWVIVGTRLVDRIYFDSTENKEISVVDSIKDTIVITDSMPSEPNPSYRYFNKRDMFSVQDIYWLDSLKNDTSSAKEFFRIADSVLNSYLKHKTNIFLLDSVLVANSFFGIETLSTDRSRDNFTVEWLSSNEWLVKPDWGKIIPDTLYSQKKCPDKYLAWARIIGILNSDSTIVGGYLDEMDEDGLPIKEVNPIGDIILLTIWEGSYSNKYSARFKAKGLRWLSDNKMVKTIDGRDIEPIFAQDGDSYKAVILKGTYLDPVYGSTYIYRSVGPASRIKIDTGTATKTLTISGSTATFSAAISDTVGVGDVIVYDTSGNAVPDTIAFIHGRIPQASTTIFTSFTVKTANGGAPRPCAATGSWKIYRAYSWLYDAERGTENNGITPTQYANFDTWSGGKNLLTNNEIWNIACYADKNRADDTTKTTGTPGLVFSGWTTQDTNYIHIYAPQADIEVGRPQRHRGRISATGYVNYRIAGGDATGGKVTLDIQQDYTDIDGLEIIYATKPLGVAALKISGKNCKIHECLIHSSATAGTVPDNCLIQLSPSVNSTSYLYNNIGFGDSAYVGAGITCNAPVAGNKIIAYNNTLYACGGGGWWSKVVDSVIVKNNLIQAGGTCYYDSGSNVVSASNYTSDATSPDGAGYQNKAQKFLDSTKLIRDFHLISTDNAIGAGTNLLTDVRFPLTYDEDYVTRPASFDIGADQYGVKYCWVGRVTGALSVWGLAGNWAAWWGGTGGVGIPGSNDTAAFGPLTSTTQICSIKTDVTVKYLKATVPYIRGIRNIANAKLTVVNGIYYDGGGATSMTGSDTIVFSGDGHFRVTLNAANLAAGNLIFMYQGNDTLITSKSVSCATNIMAYPGKVTVLRNPSPNVNSARLFLQGGTLQIDSSILVGTALNGGDTVDRPLEINGTAITSVINSSEGNTNRLFRIYRASAVSCTSYIPAINAPNVQIWMSQSTVSPSVITYSLEGNISASSLVMFATTSLCSVAFNTNGYNITAQELSIGSINGPGGTNKKIGANLIGSTININSFSNAWPCTSATIYLSNSIWNIKGPIFNLSPSHVFFPNTAIFYIKDSTSFTLRGQPVHALITDSLNKISTIDSVNCDSIVTKIGTVVIGAGINTYQSNYFLENGTVIDYSRSKLTFKKDFIIDSADVTMPSDTVIIGGNFRHRKGAFNSNNGTLVFDYQGTGRDSIIMDSLVPLYRLVLRDSGGKVFDNTKIRYVLCTTPKCTIFVIPGTTQEWDSLNFNQRTQTGITLTSPGNWNLKTQGSQIPYSKWVKFNKCNATSGNTVKCLACDDLGSYNSTGIKWYEKQVVDGVPRKMTAVDGHQRYMAQ